MSWAVCPLKTGSYHPHLPLTFVITTQLMVILLSMEGRRLSRPNIHQLWQGWVFAMAKTIFAGTVEKTGKNRGKN